MTAGRRARGRVTAAVVACSVAAGALPVAAVGQVPREEFAARRSALLDRLPDGVVVAFGAAEPPNSYTAFRQEPNAAWLTGVGEAGLRLVLVKRGAERRQWLLVEDKDPAQEVWTGRRLGTEGATARTGLAARSVRGFGALLDSLLAGGGPLHVVRGVSEEGEQSWADERALDSLRARHPSVAVAPANEAVQVLRGRKSAAELAFLREAAAITADAHREVARAMAPDQHEFELQALLEYTFRRRGADGPGFASIVGSGPNATTLHYAANDRRMAAGDLVVVDIGASWQGYSADVTRTYPVSGRFTPAQRAVYQLVRDAQAAAERAAVPGAGWQALSTAAATTLAEGLARLGLVDSASATYDCGRPRPCRQLGLYYMHGLGHGIGLEVHDPDQSYFSGALAEGSAFTLEPGIYVRRDVLETLPDTPGNRALRSRLAAAVARHADIGVRIEDDYVVTATGVDWISRAPREVAEVEAAMAEPWTGPAPRDPGVGPRYDRAAGRPAPGVSRP